MSATNTPAVATAFLLIAASCDDEAARMVQPAQGRPGWQSPAASLASGPSSPGTACPVAAATQTAALTARPAGIVSSTTTTHFSLAERVGSPVRISCGAYPATAAGASACTVPAFASVRDRQPHASHTSEPLPINPYIIRVCSRCDAPGRT